MRKTPPDDTAEAQLRASIAEHDLLENLVVRPDEPDADGIERFAVVAGGRRLAALRALAENGTLHADQPVPCKIAANGNAGDARHHAGRRADNSTDHLTACGADGNLGTRFVKRHLTRDTTAVKMPIEAKICGTQGVQVA